MAVDMFLDLGSKIPGESKDKTHKDKIDVLAWSWGMAGSGAGKASLQDISLTKWVDKSSVNLMAVCASGDHLPEAKLIVRKAGGKKPIEYIVFTLKTVNITSVSTGGSGGEDRLTENVTLSFNKIKLDYVPEKEDGTGGAAVHFTWNVEQNAAD